MSGIIAQNTLDSSGLIKAPTGGGAWTFISKQTASSSSDISFTSGLDSTYKVYLFTFTNAHPATDGANLQVNFTDGSSDLSKQSTCLRLYHTEAGSSPLFDYLDGLDLNNSTSEQTLVENNGNGNDESISGFLYLYSPSDTTFVKNYMGNAMGYQKNNAVNSQITGGYVNSTSAVTVARFQMNTGNVDAGDFCLYGLST
jgi:hypothetical protein